jgi:hypothetical protein
MPSLPAALVVRAGGLRDAARRGDVGGVVIPEAGRGRTHTLRRLRSLAERGGYPVRQPASAIVLTAVG